MTFSEKQPGYNPKTIVDHSIKEPLAALFPYAVKDLEVEFQEKGSSGNAYRVAVIDTKEQRHELLLKREESFDYVGFHNDYLEPYGLNSPKVYGHIQQGSDKLLVADYIPHEQPDWQNPDRYRQALQWLMHKDSVTSSNLDKLRNLPYLDLMQWYGTEDWLSEIEQGHKNLVHPILTAELWSMLSANKTRLNKYLTDLKTEGPQTIVHGDFNMNNTLFGKGEYEGRLFVIDWTQPHVSSVLHDLVHLVDGAPEGIKEELINTYRASTDISNFNELYRKAEALWYVHYFAWMVMMLNEGQGNAIHQKDLQRIKDRLESSLSSR